MTERNAPRAWTRSWVVVSLLAICAAGVGLACGWRHGESSSTANPEPQQPPAGDPTALFGQWPQGVKPDAVVVLSGQTFGLLQPCGCSAKQLGGLERRANFIAGLRAKGWPVVGADLGDLVQEKGAIPEQTLMKYVTAMNALREMGYVAVGVGKTEFDVGIFNVLAQYAAQKEQPPYVLAGNLIGKSDGKVIPREQFFPASQPGGRPMVGLAEIADVGGVPVGVVGVIGKDLSEDGRKADPLLEFAFTPDVLKQAVTALAAHPRKPALNVLLYQDTLENARAVAKDRPEFQIILCRSAEAEPPQFPVVVEGAGGRKTLIVQVGHKGRYVGVVGAFRKPDGSFDLKYQLVGLGDEYATPADPAAEKANPVLPLLEDYSKQVKDRNLLAKYPKVPHPAQIQAPNLNLSYVGSEKCAACHQAETAKWKESLHSHALEALETKAKRPSLRQFDGECVVCHTVGLGYRTGFESAEKTPHLKHVGCESCHGPGSGHASAEHNAELLKLLSPWKQNPADRLPDAQTMQKLGDLNPIERGKVQIPPAQNRMINAVTSACMKCHDSENDPHFDLFKYWPKVAHTGLGPLRK
jgi:hypothetical protein